MPDVMRYREDAGTLSKTEFSTAWPHKPPKIINLGPLMKLQPAFNRIDQTVLAELFDNFGWAGSPFWYMGLFNPFHPAARIPCLRTNTNMAKSFAGLRYLFQQRSTRRFNWMIGASFITDGVQVKLELDTPVLERPTAAGLDGLHKKKYTGR
jgi:hypothetical protein